MNRISVLIQSYNEETNIRHALESCAWADEIFVVDNFSSDATPDIVKSFSNTHLVQRKFDGYAKQKNWALDTLPFTGEWICILDADECITPELRDELVRVTSDSLSPECWYVNRRFYFLGRWIRHAGWYPSWSLRFFKKSAARYEDRGVDEHMIPSGSVGYIAKDLIHEDHKGLEAWIKKHNRYSSLEATERIRPTETLDGSLFSRNPVEQKRALKNIFYRLPGRPFLRFFIMYVIQRGFLDGYPGFVFCILRGIQEFHISIKLKELNEREMKK